MKKMLVGNWKANYSYSMLVKLGHLNECKNVSVSIAAPFLYIPMAKQTLPTYYKLAGQDCSQFDLGAFTGEIPANMLRDIGVRQVILGHSERRHKNHESNKVLEKKLEMALNAKLDVIFCVGETLEQRKDTKEVINEQMTMLKESMKVNIAYEPVYAIGTGVVPTNEEIRDTLSFIKSEMKKKMVVGKVLYGGSVTKDNIRELCKIENVEGFLVGGASLKEEFLQIIAACDE